MNPELSSFAAHLREMIANRQSAVGHRQFSELALELFSLQFNHNAAYRKICEARTLPPQVVGHWTQIPAVPTAAFKELELTCLAPDERTTVFHSSGTTEQKPSRHFHNTESLAVYEVSLWASFERHVLWSAESLSASREAGTRGQAVRAPLLILTPPPSQAPHSSLVHMFEVLRQKLGAPETVFLGQIGPAGAWTLDLAATLAALSDSSKLKTQNPKLLLGTAFSFMHLIDCLVERNLRVELPAGSRVMETGGYKNRSRTLPKVELHTLIAEQLGVSMENILCEYGMSELSSQAYDVASDKWHVTWEGDFSRHSSPVTRHFSFPPWAHVQIISPETGREVAEGETGLIRIFDLANVFSVLAIQTEDLGVRRGDGFELIGRAQLAEPRGCSLMTA